MNQIPVWLVRGRKTSRLKVIPKTPWKCKDIIPPHHSYEVQIIGAPDKKSAEQTFKDGTYAVYYPRIEVLLIEGCYSEKSGVLMCAPDQFVLRNNYEGPFDD